MQSKFTITLIESSFSEAIRLTLIACEAINTFSLAIVRDVAEAVAKAEMSAVILLNYEQMTGDWAESISLLGRAYPQTPIILLLPPTYNEAEVGHVLTLGAADYVVLSDLGLLALSRRLVAWHQLWVAQAPPAPSLTDLLQEIPHQLTWQVISPDHRLLALNPLAKQLFGITAAQPIGLPLTDLGLTSENLARLKDVLDQAQTTLIPFSVDSYLLNQAEMIWLQLHVFPQVDPDSKKLIKICLLGANITALKEAELALTTNSSWVETQRNLSELKLLYEVSSSIATIWSNQSALNKLVRKVVEAIEVSGGYLATWDKAKQLAVVEARFFHTPPILPGSFSLLERPQLLSILQQGQSKVYSYNTPQDEIERVTMQRYGCTTRLVTPLIAKGEAIGWLELWAQTPGYHFNHERVRLVETLANQAAIAFGNIQYLNQMQKMLEEMAALYHITSALATHREAPTIIKLVLTEYLQSLDLEVGAVLYLESHKEYFSRFEVHLPQPELTVISKQPFDLHEVVYNLLLETQEMVLIEDTRQGWLVSGEVSRPVPVTLTPWCSPQVISALIIPIKILNEIQGAVIVEAWDNPYPFTERDLSLGQALTDQLSIALHNVFMYEAEQRHRRHAELLREAAAVVGASLNLREVLAGVLDQLKRLLHYDTAMVHLIEGDRRRVVAGRGFPDLAKLLGTTLPIKLNEQDPSTIVMHTRTPLVVSQVVQQYTQFRHPLAEQVQSWLGLPLIVGERVIGLILVDSFQLGAYGETEAELGFAFAEQVATALENARLHEIYINRIEHELEIAQEIQETLLPQVVPDVPGLKISGRILPARQVGGDFFHFFSVGGGNQLGVAVGDVSGKGIPAALYMAVAITAIDIQVRTDLTPGQLMNRLNEALYNRLRENKMNIGLQVAIFEPLLAPEGESDTDAEARGVLMTAASGGMIAPIGATERGCRFLPVSGLPIGALPSPDHTYEDDMFLLDPFTTIIFTSDGIVEAQNEQGELFGFDRLEATINEIAGVRDAEMVADYIISAAQKFMGKAEQHDDMTVVVVVKT